METTKLNVQELSLQDQQNIEGGVAPLLIVGAIYAGSLLGGAAVGYGTFKLVEWVVN